MYREYVKECRSEQHRVKIELMNGKFVEGEIVNHGPEALLLQTSPGVHRCVLKHAIVSIGPASRRERDR